ncbi:MAG: hypothetical protein RI911_764 [Candidatus Parcubacteria bacterium]|jgi:predicted RNA-binding protein YlqC (UPF0109 family)
MQHDEAFLDYVIKALVDHPESVVITRTVDQMGVLLTLTVHKDDMGKVIGRDGATAKAVRTLLRVAGMKNDARVNLKINEPEGSDHVRAERPAASLGGTSLQDATGGYVHTNPAPAPASERMKTVDEVLADL